jgi:hypothetical protein
MVLMWYNFFMPKSPQTETLPDLQDDFELETKTLENKLTAEFNLQFVKLLKRLAYEIAVVGLSEEEACMLMDYDYVTLQGIKQRSPLIRQLFDRKALEYKRDLIKTMSNKARAGDDKIALWLLESRYPDEFNRKRGKGDGDPEDMLGAAISFVQKSSSGSIVTETAGQAFLVAKKETKDNIPTIEQILKRAQAKATSF